MLPRMVVSLELQNMMMIWLLIQTPMKLFGDPILDGAGDPEESDRTRTSSLAGTLVPGLDAINLEITLPDGTQQTIADIQNDTTHEDLVSILNTNLHLTILL